MANFINLPSKFLYPCIMEIGNI